MIVGSSSMGSELAPAPHMSGITHMGPAGVLGGMMAAGMVTFSLFAYHLKVPNSRKPFLIQLK